MPANNLLGSGVYIDQSENPKIWYKTPPLRLPYVAPLAISGKFWANWGNIDFPLLFNIYKYNNSKIKIDITEYHKKSFMYFILKIRFHFDDTKYEIIDKLNSVITIILEKDIKANSEIIKTKPITIDNLWIESFSEIKLINRIMNIE